VTSTTTHASSTAVPIEASSRTVPLICIRPSPAKRRKKNHPRYALYNAASLVGGDESSATSENASSTHSGE
jgi:hypothetical protein